ncbi:uncharacterized protein DUF5017 [Flavobacterium sp. 90]|uniref:DUF5689 domain-containing protein n=1 Tax=unclassified Flavobacterium TaxID=196869 RepID=UPI000EAB6071|nr:MULTISPECIES: DUF5689 domain-containing protein [unclassified Flavobacterium]RKR10043.1 uncharacterized protein DUF5017 [Flavobacterium sp. 81]TCK53828.1 uncharacterized protein DUF5017 [Flavobacterium sp. 90]
MKNRFLSPFLAFVLVFFYSCNNEVEIPKLACTQPDLTVNQTVQKVKDLSGSVPKQYSYNDIIEAYVVSSDEEGNFFKTISFQTLATDKTPAIGFSIPVDVSNSYIDFRIGNKVYIKLKNQFTDLYFEGLRIGSLYVSNAGDPTIGRVSQNDYKNVLNASCTIIDESELVQSVSIEEALNESKLNTLIELTNVQFTEAAIGRHYFEESNNVGGSTNWNLRDKTGNQIIFRTSGYASFADHFVPEGSGKVRGILTKFGSDYQLMIRSEKDVEMNGKRNIPFFDEDFQSVKNNVNFALPGWSNIVQKASKLWKSMLYAGNGYAEFNTTSTTAAENVAWLVTPKINLGDYKNVVFSFRSAQHDLKVDSPLNSLEVYVSTDFNGSSITKANWTKLEANFASLSTPSRQFISSGGIDLSSYSGNIHIAFKYIGSGKDKTLNGAFMVDDVRIFGEK